MAFPFDPSDYVRAPIITVSSGITLALALVSSCPKTAPTNVRKAATHLEGVAVGARTLLADRNRAVGTYSEEDTRVLDNEADRYWGGFRMRLQAAAMLNPDKWPKAKLAAELDARLFTEGMEFLKVEYSAQSAIMGALLERIATDHLQADLDDLLGPEYLAALRDVQPRYEAMVLERIRRDKATGQNLTETVAALKAAIVNYAGKVVGTVEHDDPATLEAARIALLPIANHRAAVAARRGGAEDEAGGEGPVTPT